MVLDPRFTGWHPVPLAGCELTHFEDLLEMVHVLDVAAVMPSKYIWLFTVDQVSHCLDPVRILDGVQPSILCILHNLEDVTTF